MKKSISVFFMLLLCGALCCISYASDAEYTIEDATSAMRLLSKRSTIGFDTAKYEVSGDGTLRLDDVLKLIKHCQENYEPSDCAWTHRNDHDCITDDIVPGHFIDLVYEGTPYTMNYRVRLPESYSPDREYAVLVYLHGLGSERQPITQLTGSTLFTNVLSSSYADETILVIPQCPKGTSWPDQRQTVETAYAIIDMLAKHLPVDRNRLYLSGYSNGAKGVAYMIDSHPRVFAAAVLVAGASKLSSYKDCEGMAQTPMRMYCGDQDSYKFYIDMHDLAYKLRMLGGDVEYTEYIGFGHSIFPKVGNEPGLIDWIFSQSLAED